MSRNPKPSPDLVLAAFPLYWNYTLLVYRMRSGGWMALTELHHFRNPDQLIGVRAPWEPACVLSLN